MKSSIKLVVVSLGHFGWIIFTLIKPNFWGDYLSDFYHLLIISFSLNFMQIVVFLDESILPNYRNFSFFKKNYFSQLFERLLLYLKTTACLPLLYFISFFLVPRALYIQAFIIILFVFSQIIGSILTLVVWDYCKTKSFREVASIIPLLFILSTKAIDFEQTLTIDALFSNLFFYSIWMVISISIIISITIRFNRNWF